MPHLLVALSSHGFGHAAQTAPIVNALRQLRPDVRLTLRTSLPAPFLRSRFSGDFDLLAGPDDFGLVMESALAVDLEQSAARYASLHAAWEARIDTEAKRLTVLKPDLVVANVSYLMLAAARASGIPGIALCSFTWSLIYEHYFRGRPQAAEILAQMRAGYAGAAAVLALAPGMPLDVPHCEPVGTIARPGHSVRAALCAALGLAPTQRLVVLSLGGINHELDLARWPIVPSLHWLVPRAMCPARPDMTAQESLPFHFGDLLASADALITKPGYGTFTEAACNNIPVLYISRGDWPEEPYLVQWMQQQRRRLLPISAESLLAGDIPSTLEALWALPPTTAVPASSAASVAHRLAGYF